MHVAPSVLDEQSPPYRQDVKNTQWFEISRPSTVPAAVKRPYPFKKIAPFISGALPELTGGRETEVSADLVGGVPIIGTCPQRCQRSKQTSVGAAVAQMPNERESVAWE